MKVSDYIVDYLISEGITDVFGYPGGMVTHFMDSLGKRSKEIGSHLTYHEQGAAFAACGYAQLSGKVGVAYATSGPGATNLVTGICNAYFDSIPALFLTGQVNVFEAKGDRNIRQRGFQETDIVSMVSGVTKYAAQITDADKIRWYLDRAFFEAQSGRKGPVLLDIPMNILRSEVETDALERFVPEKQCGTHEERWYKAELESALRTAEKPVLLLGSGIKSANAVELARRVQQKLAIPTVTTMPAADIPAESGWNYGFIGAYGSRAANFAAAKSDLIISLGARLDVRQVGGKRENFAPDARIIRVDIDSGELEYKVRSDEMPICDDVVNVLETLLSLSPVKRYDAWIRVCERIRDKLCGIDDRLPNQLLKKIGAYLPADAVITTDVGQNQVWVAQSLPMKEEQIMLSSSGHGAMGYSLPAAVGAALASGRTVFSFCGDGGLQMNIQELQTVVREGLPVKIILLNNASLGMIRHFQEMYFESFYFQTTSSGGYTVPDFASIAKAYGLPYALIRSEEDCSKALFDGAGPAFIEVQLPEETYVFPKLEFGKPNQDQEPLLDRRLYEELDALNVGDV